MGFFAWLEGDPPNSGCGDSMLNGFFNLMNQLQGLHFGVPHCLTHNHLALTNRLRKGPGGENFVIEVAQLAAEVGGGALGGDTRVAERPSAGEA